MPEHDERRVEEALGRLSRRSKGFFTPGQVAAEASWLGRTFGFATTDHILRGLEGRGAATARRRYGIGSNYRSAR